MCSYKHNLMNTDISKNIFEIYESTIEKMNIRFGIKIENDVLNDDNDKKI